MLCTRVGVAGNHNVGEYFQFLESLALIEWQVEVAYAVPPTAHLGRVITSQRASTEEYVSAARATSFYTAGAYPKQVRELCWSLGSGTPLCVWGLGSNMEFPNREFEHRVPKPRIRMSSKSRVV